MNNTTHGLTCNFMGQVFEAATGLDTGYRLSSADMRRSLNDVLTELRARMDREPEGVGK